MLFNSRVRFSAILSGWFVVMHTYLYYIPLPFSLSKQVYKFIFAELCNQCACGLCISYCLGFSPKKRCTFYRTLPHISVAVFAG